MKIIQIAVMPGSQDNAPTLFALSDEGTIVSKQLDNFDSFGWKNIRLTDNSDSKERANWDSKERAIREIAFSLKEISKRQDCSFTVSVHLNDLEKRLLSLTK